ncbi:MAG: septal ring lytic transglycosylase RlpA family protein [Rhodothermales bacterium]|nr:septal ring lytic transglycosylase RlpA family protein [Rhodothermales bacterium]
MIQDQRASETRKQGFGMRRLRSAERARLILGTAAVSIFALGGYLSVSTSHGTQPVEALGLQTALFPSSPAVATAPAPDTTLPTPEPDALPAPAAVRVTPETEASSAREAAPAAENGAEGTFFQQGHTSYYAHEFAGRRTANGERFNPEAMTAAHKTLPFGTRIRVTSTATGRSVIVRVNDRGPFVRGRILDLSLGAARALGIHRSGGGQVRIDVLGRGPRRMQEATPERTEATVAETRRPAAKPSARPMRTADEMLGAVNDTTQP